VFECPVLTVKTSLWYISMISPAYVTNYCILYILMCLILRKVRYRNVVMTDSFMNFNFIFSKYNFYLFHSILITRKIDSE